MRLNEYNKWGSPEVGSRMPDGLRSTLREKGQWDVALSNGYIRNVEFKPNQLIVGDIVGLLVTPDGHMVMTVNEEVRYFVKDCGIPSRGPFHAVIDLDGHTRSVQLMDDD